MNTQDRPLVFFIDDEPMSNMFNSMLIQRIHPDVEIKTFTNGLNALIDLKNPLSKKPQVIFLDLYMPEMNGWDFMEEFKKTGLDIEVVVLTSSNESSDKERAEKDNQIKDYVVKPLTKSSFTDVLKRFFQNQNFIGGSGTKYPFI